MLSILTLILATSGSFADVAISNDRAIALKTISHCLNGRPTDRARCYGKGLEQLQSPSGRILKGACDAMKEASPFIMESAFCYGHALQSFLDLVETANEKNEEDILKRLCSIANKPRTKDVCYVYGAASSEKLGSVAQSCLSAGHDLEGRIACFERQLQ